MVSSVRDLDLWANFHHQQKGNYDYCTLSETDVDYMLPEIDRDWDLDGYDPTTRKFYVWVDENGERNVDILYWEKKVNYQ
jgi:hypothetical protein